MFSHLGAEEYRPHVAISKITFTISKLSEHFHALSYAYTTKLQNGTYLFLAAKRLGALINEQENCRGNEFSENCFRYLLSVAFAANFLTKTSSGHKLASKALLNSTKPLVKRDHREDVWMLLVSSALHFSLHISGDKNEILSSDNTNSKQVLQRLSTGTTHLLFNTNIVSLKSEKPRANHNWRCAQLIQEVLSFE